MPCFETCIIRKQKGAPKTHFWRALLASLTFCMRRFSLLSPANRLHHPCKNLCDSVRCTRAEGIRFFVMLSPQSVDRFIQIRRLFIQVKIVWGDNIANLIIGEAEYHELIVPSNLPQGRRIDACRCALGGFLGAQIAAVYQLRVDFSRDQQDFETVDLLLHNCALFY